MCEGKGCDVKETCYRFKATPNKYRQSYIFPSNFKGSACDYYWNLQK